MELFDLSGRVAVVTGGNGGIGPCMALAWQRLVPRSSWGAVTPPRTPRPSSRSRRPAPRRAQFRSTCSRGVLPALIADTMTAHGRLDILVNNAGMSIRASQPEQYTLTKWHTVMDSNLTSAFLCSTRPFPR